MSASWFLVSKYLICILGYKLIPSNNQSRATLWVLETCLTVSILPMYDHLDHCFVVFKDVQQSFLKRSTARLRKYNQHCLDHQSFHEFCFALEICAGLSVLDLSETCFPELRRSDPMNQLRGYVIQP